jgi:hypothetical protein
MSDPHIYYVSHVATGFSLLRSDRVKQFQHFQRLASKSRRLTELDNGYIKQPF